MRFLFSFFSPPHRFYVSLPPRRKDEDTQRSNFNRKIVNRKIVNITMILFFRTPSKSVIAVECNHELPQADSDKLCWLFGEATPESEDNLKGHFVGPRREMITPWSTNAVEITQNMGLDGIIRIEEYFPVKDENADHDPMLQRMYKGLDQNVFTTNRQPEPIVHIEDLEAYNEKEGLALSKEEMDYLKKVERDLGRPLTDSEVFGFAQINSEHCRHKIFGGTFIIDGRRLKSINQWFNKENTRLQSIKDKQHFGKKTTNRQKALARRRNNRINDYMNKTARRVIDYCIDHDIGTLVVGYNETFQKDSNIGKRNNQTFQLFHYLTARFIGRKFFGSVRLRRTEAFIFAEILKNGKIVLYGITFGCLFLYTVFYSFILTGELVFPQRIFFCKLIQMHFIVLLFIAQLRLMVKQFSLVFFIIPHKRLFL